MAEDPVKIVVGQAGIEVVWPVVSVVTSSTASNGKKSTRVRTPATSSCASPATAPFTRLGTGRYEIRAIGPAARPGRPVHAPQAADHRRAARHRRGRPRAADQGQGAGGALVRRALQRGLRHRRDHARAAAGGHGRAEASLPIGAVLVVLLFVVGFSYRQTIKAYPTGGGSYIVAKDNLGTLPGLTAGGLAADLVHADRGGLGRGGRAGAGLGLPVARSVQRGDRRRGRSS